MNDLKRITHKLLILLPLMFLSIGACTVQNDSITLVTRIVSTPKNIIPSQTPTPTISIVNSTNAAETPIAVVSPSATPEYPVTSQNNLLQTLTSPRIPDEGEVVFMIFSETGSLVSFDFDLPEDGGWIDRDNMIWSESMPSSSFSNHTDLIAYIDFDNQVWVADIANRNPIMIYRYPQSILDYPELIWTPDDFHLIIDNKDPDDSDFILDLRSGQLQTWSFVCDRVATSPVSHQLSIWCKAKSEPTLYAVLEWQGEIWYSEAPPEVEVFKAFSDEVKGLSTSPYDLFPILRNSNWSSDGESIAYFDPDDPNGGLVISSTDGKILTRIEHRAPWLTDWIQEGRSIPSHTIQWSRDGTKLLFYGVGESNNNCPTIDDEVHNKTYINPGCWQVVDVESGLTIWSVADLVDQEPEFRRNAFFDSASISVKGEYLATYSFFPGDYKVYIIELDTGKVRFSPPFRVSDIHWGYK